jgi:two-component system chemotaxis sensor kinase CheA
MSNDRIDFSAEAAERLETVNAVLGFDHPPRIGEINELFRAVHSLKGLAGLKGFGRLARALHEAETLLDAVRLSKIPWTDAVRAALGRFFRVFELAMGPAAARGSDEGFSPEDAIAELSLAREPAPAAPLLPLSGALDLSERTLACLSEYEESRLRFHLASGTPIYTIDVGFPLDMFEPSLKALGAKLNREGEWIATLPQASGFTAERLAVQLVVASAAKPSGLPEDASVRVISRLPTPGRAEESARTPPGRTVRLETARLEAFLSEAEEVRARFQRLAGDVARWERNLPPSERVITARLRRRVEVSLSNLTRQAAAIRTLPISFLADRLRRAAERVVEASGKKAVFRILGGDSEIDRTLAEDLADPLLHLLRNAIDHGIELPAARVAAGKPEAGTVTLMVRSKNSRLLISIGDDGRGIDIPAVVRRARDLGWVASGHEPTEAEAHAYLFRPGFSTASAVSEISGRGVGLDLVAARVEARHGEVRVASSPGTGTRFEIEIANSQAVFDAMIVLEEGRPYAFPVAAIGRVERERAETGAVALSRALNGTAPSPDGRRTAMILPDGSSISVAKVLRQEMIVVRAVETADPPPFLIGASQGRGAEVILVLDPKRLLRHAGTRIAAAGGAR